ncbi:cytochrome C [Methyloterricola oryzae]|uniref:cytochrome C n=1 Tax=Methyloterricola oryzae TaxID=1495050 RepID=UPI001300FED2|nr:cytochrome C [Methyloterricola oryzae]
MKSTWIMAVLLVSTGVEARLFDDGQLSKMDAGYREECGSCHVAYPAAFLPAASWRAILGSLDDHFKVDATLEESSLPAIQTYLKEHAGRDAAPGMQAPPCITKAPWFVPKHARVRGAGWPRVKTLSNCPACHLEAESGRFARIVAKGR